MRLDFGTQEPAVPAADQSAGMDAVSRFAVQFAAALEADESARFGNVAINQLARQIFGTAAGHSRDAYDAAEAGFNLYLARQGLASSIVEEAITWLKSQDGRLPLQNKRDYRQVELQQFSTPHTEAYLVVWAAALRAGMRVLEPSAGTGNIAVLAKLLGAQVDTNEIDPRRRNLLKLQGFEPTDVDAERLDKAMAMPIASDEQIAPAPTWTAARSKEDSRSPEASFESPPRQFPEPLRAHGREASAQVRLFLGLRP